MQSNSFSLEDAYTESLVQRENQSNREWFKAYIGSVNVDSGAIQEGLQATKSSSPTSPALPEPKTLQQGVTDVLAGIGGFTADKFSGVMQQAGFTDPGLTESVWAWATNKPQPAVLQGLDFLFKVFDAVPNMARGVALPKNPNVEQAVTEWINELPAPLRPLVPGGMVPEQAGKDAQETYDTVGTILELGTAFIPGTDLFDYLPALGRKIKQAAFSVAKPLTNEVGAKGIPVYHGTTLKNAESIKNIGTFDIGKAGTGLEKQFSGYMQDIAGQGFYVTSKPELANKYARSVSGEKTGEVIQFQVLKQPFEAGEWSNIRDGVLKWWTGKAGNTPEQFIKDIEPYPLERTKVINAYAKSLKFPGVKYNEDEIIFWDSNAIKVKE